MQLKTPYLRTGRKVILGSFVYEYQSQNRLQKLLFKLQIVGKMNNALPQL